MSHFVDCVGWAASKMVFVFFYHFAADLRTFFLTSQPNHQKTMCFWRFGCLWPARKPADKKKRISSQRCALFFWFQIWITSYLQKVASPEELHWPRQRATPQRHAKPERRAKPQRRTKPSCGCILLQHGDVIFIVKTDILKIKICFSLWKLMV